MMKKINKTAAVVLTLVLILSLAACGSPAQNGNNGSSGANNASGSADNSAAAPEDNAAGGNNDQAPANNAAPEPRQGKETLVIYFSATGTTKALAERIAQFADADIFEIVPEVPYTSADLNYNDKSSRATKEQNDASARPGIAGEAIAPDQYKTIYLGYPIWFSKAPRIMCTFVETYKLGNIRIVPFCTSGSSPIGSSASELEKLADGGVWQKGGRLAKSISDADLKAWIENNR